MDPFSQIPEHGLDDLGLVVGICAGSLLLLLSMGYVGFWILARVLVSKQPTDGQTFGFTLIYLVCFSLSLVGIQAVASQGPAWLQLVVQFGIFLPCFVLALLLTFHASILRAILCAPVFALFAIVPTLFFATVLQPRMQATIGKVSAHMEEIQKKWHSKGKAAPAPTPQPSAKGATTSVSILQDRERTMAERSLALRRIELTAAYQEVKAFHDRVEKDPTLTADYARQLEIYNQAMTQMTADEAALVKPVPK